MAVLIRTTEEVHDTRVATSTVVGMVLGVLSLFVLIVTYQFLPRRASSRPRAVSALAPPPPKPRPLVVRIRTRCSTLLNSIFRKRQTPTTEPAQPGHRTMRSFHLTPERRREREHNRLKFAKSLRIKIDLPPFPHVSLSNTPASTPRPPKRAYSRMRDSDDGYECLLKPESTPHTPLTPHTPHTPRSPPDYPSPTSPPPRFRPFASPMPFPGSPPPLYPPPPAYVPRTPLRGGFTSPYNDERRDKRQSLADPFADPFGDSEQSKTEKEREDADTLMAEIQQIIEYNVCDDEPEAGEGPFVVGDSDEEDVGSLSECSV